MARCLKPGSIAARVVEFLEAHPGRSYHPGDLPGFLGLGLSDVPYLMTTLSLLHKRCRIKRIHFQTGHATYRYTAVTIPARLAA